MRFYKIVVTDPDNIVPPRTWSSLNADGSYNPNAQNVEFDIPLSTFATPTTAAYVRIWGVSLADIGQASDFNNYGIAIYGGMSQGLPLANAAQSGLLLSGTIQQAFGNWIGVQQSLDFIVMPQVTPPNITLTWRKGTELVQAITQTLQTAFGGSYSIDTSGLQETTGFVLSEDQVGFFDNIAQFATFIKQASYAAQPIKPVSGQGYSGMDIILQGNVIRLIDNSGAKISLPRQIAFTDLIGQPTWIGLYQMQFNCIMRADLSLGDYIKMPPSVVITAPSSYSQYRNKSAFQGVFQILGQQSTIRHVGNYRQQDGYSWITTVNCVQVNTQAPQVTMISRPTQGLGIGSVA